jgi:hypothetical protein
VTTHIIVIEPTILGARGQYYRAKFQEEVLVQHSRVPEYDACRKLLARGITGRLETYMGDSYPHLILDIETAAKRTIREDEHWSPTQVPYRARTEAANDNGVSHDAEAA